MCKYGWLVLHSILFETKTTCRILCVWLVCGLFVKLEIIVETIMCFCLADDGQHHSIRPRRTPKIRPYVKSNVKQEDRSLW